MCSFYNTYNYYLNDYQYSSIRVTGKYVNSGRKHEG